MGLSLSKLNYFECVPNICAGSNHEIVQFIQSQLKKIPDLLILHTDIGIEVNRTVFTLAGTHAAISKASRELAKLCYQYIDMSQLSSIHPRLGALDVCPVVPLGASTIEQSQTLAREIGKSIAEELGVPVFLYAFAALDPNRFRLEDVRRGQYEKLRERFEVNKEQPDYGPAEFVKHYGASIVGARRLLVAYNIEVLTTDVQHARKIAASIRESKANTSLAGVKAIGWQFPNSGKVQLSTNIIDFKTTGIAKVHEASKIIAKSLGVELGASELIGLIPEQALLEAGQYYTELAHINNSLTREDLIDVALSELKFDNFIKDQRILERALLRNLS